MEIGKNSKHHEYSAMVVRVKPDLYIGVVLEIAGAASFAKTEEELLERLKDAARCIEEATKSEYKEVFKNNFKMFGKPTEVSIPCGL